MPAQNAGNFQILYNGLFCGDVFFHNIRGMILLSL